MSEYYNNYLNEHITNVHRAFKWIRTNIGVYSDLIDIPNHDESKFDREEYIAYDDYFYGTKTKEVKEKFNFAWLHHIHNNPHHWQYWVLVNDDPEEGTIALDIPYRYVIEMICDWWSFSWSNGDLYEIFDWYDKHKEHMILSKNTRELVEEILNSIKEKIDTYEDPLEILDTKIVNLYDKENQNENSVRKEK